jgi:hypothetical protein
MRRAAVLLLSVLLAAMGAAPAYADEPVPPVPAEAPPAEAPPAEAPPAETPPAQQPAALPAAEAPAAAVPVSRLPLREGAAGWRVRDIQERLQWLGYPIAAGNIDSERMGTSTVAAVQRFQTKFGFRPTGVVGAGTWDLLRQLSGRPGRLPKACLGERAICIDKTQRLVRLVENGRPVLTLDARFGFEAAATREGSFRVFRKSRDHTSSLYRTWMPFALFFSGGQAVHYSPYFARDGYNGASHGCVNLRDFRDAEWLFDRVPIGTPVHVYRS